MRSGLWLVRFLMSLGLTRPFTATALLTVLSLLALGPDGGLQATETGQPPPPRVATADYFLKIDGIPGDSTDARHRDEMEIVSWSVGGEQSSSGTSMAGGGGSGKISLRDFQFTAFQGKASPMLFLACASGKHIRDVTLTARKKGANQPEYLIVKLSDVIVTSYQTGSSEEGVAPDRVSLGFATIEFEYRGQNPDGTAATPVRAGWDVRQNKSIP